MSDISDLGRSLAVRVQEKQKADLLLEAANLRRADVLRLKLSDLWSQFCALVQDGITSFNTQSSKLALVFPPSTTEIRVDFDGRLIFMGRIVEGMATQITFARTASSDTKPLDWYTVTLSPREELTIINPQRLSINSAEELAKAGLKFMFAPLTGPPTKD